MQFHLTIVIVLFVCIHLAPVSLEHRAYLESLLFLILFILNCERSRMTEWLTRLPLDQKVQGSIPPWH